MVGLLIQICYVIFLMIFFNISLFCVDNLLTCFSFLLLFMIFVFIFHRYVLLFVKYKCKELELHNPWYLSGIFFFNYLQINICVQLLICIICIGMLSLF